MKPTPGRVVIFGQYKTGTTALFTKIRNSLPSKEPEPRTLFEQREYRPEPEDELRWVLAKTILKYVGHPDPVDYESFLGFDRRIFLTRDPRDWLVSWALFHCQETPFVLRSQESTNWVMDYLRKKEAEPQRFPLRNLLEYLFSAPPVMELTSFGEKIRGEHAFCMEMEGRLRANYFKLRYEDFVDGRLQAIRDYLEFDLEGDANVDSCFAHVPRTCAHSDWKNWLTPEDEAFFREYFEPYISHYGYEPEWLPSEQPRIDPAHASRYVERIIEMKRQRLAAQG